MADGESASFLYRKRVARVQSCGAALTTWLFEAGIVYGGWKHMRNKNPSSGTRASTRELWLLRSTGQFGVTLPQQHTRKKFILEELPNSSETEDMRKIR